MSSVLGLDRAPLLRPVAALAGWTFVVEVWMVCFSRYFILGVLVCPLLLFLSMVFECVVVVVYAGDGGMVLSTVSGYRSMLCTRYGVSRSYRSTALPSSIFFSAFALHVFSLSLGLSIVCLPSFPSLPLISIPKSIHHTFPTPPPSPPRLSHLSHPFPKTPKQKNCERETKQKRPHSSTPPASPPSPATTSPPTRKRAETKSPPRSRLASAGSRRILIICTSSRRCFTQWLRGWRCWVRVSCLLFPCLLAHILAPFSIFGLPCWNGWNKSAKRGI